MADIIRRSIYWGMSEDAIRARVAEIAKSLLGIKEGTQEYEDKIRGVYNKHKPLPRGYALSKKDPWCAAYVTVVGILAEISDVILPECGCGKMIDLYKRQGLWEERDDYDGQIGDILMWDWQDNGKGDCTGAPDHVGILVEKDGDKWKLAEGNYDNQVKIRIVYRNQIHIRGWCLPGYAALVHGYQDVPKDAWFRKAVEWADGRGITEGIGGHDFAPNLGCTRAHVVTMLHRYHGCPEAKPGPLFEDVQDGAWYYKAVAWAAGEGITEGIAKGCFAPDALCTRAQIVTMLWRAAGRPLAENGDHPFKDVAGDAWYSDAVEWAWCKGITIGCSATAFAPFGVCNRAQLVEMLYRLSKM